MTTETPADEIPVAPVVDKDIPKDNFWQEGQYKHSIIRIENGMRQCDDLMSFIKDRAHVEEQYCKGLKEWSAKYQKVIEKGTAYNTSKTSWLEMLKEAKKVAKLHSVMKDNLLSGPFEKVKQWKTDNYHGALLFGIKESKMFSQEFYIAQKPWRKKCKKLNRIRRNYINISRLEHSIQSQAETSSINESLPPDKLAKLQGQASKKTLAKNKLKYKYKEVMQDLEKEKDRYIENMERVFGKCQNLEEKRLQFFKQTFLDIHNLIDLSKSPSYTEAYVELGYAINHLSPQDDVKWWWTNHGPGMPFYAPKFQEYDPKNPNAFKKGIQGCEQTAISFQSKLSPLSEISPRPKSITATSFHDPWKDHDADKDTLVLQQQSSGSVNQHFSASFSPPFVQSSVDDRNQAQDFVDSTLLADLSFNDANAPWQDFGTDDDSEVAPGDGILVRAVYSYDGQEEDELTFAKDESFYMIEQEDTQGWCKGRLKNGRVGLYPAGYVVVVESPISHSDNFLVDFEI